jgi:dienelactone hydrolase
VRSRCVPALLVAVGLGVGGCGGGVTHAHAAAPTATPAAATTATGGCVRSVPADLAAPGPFRVRAAHIRLARRATTSSQVRHIDPWAWFPASRCRFPLIVFSHGANGKPTGYRLLLRHLASEGFVVLAPHHPDRTAQGDEATERVDDVTYLLDHLPAVAGRLAPATIDAKRVGVAGHSFGAFVASNEAVSEPRIRAALPMAGPLRPGPAASTRVPVLAMTGLSDTLVPSRLVRAYYAQLPSSVPHGLLQIGRADHSAYGDHCVVEKTCAIVQAYATSFFLTYLDGLRSADRLLNPATQRPARLRLQTVRMP